jgi:DNA topoisomerase IA
VSADEYTLLIVESPVIARILQRVSPPHINILATHGYCWKPEYLPKKHQLKARANPKQREFRKELKEQAQWAVNIVIATDPDPSGDFLAWALSRFLKSPQILRSSVKNLDRNGVMNTVSSAVSVHPGELHTTLKNRSLIRHEWTTSRLPGLEIAALAAAFGSSIPFTTFLDESQTLFHSSEPIPAPLGRQLNANLLDRESHYRLKHPLSTYEAVENTVTLELAGSRREAQQMLQELFTAEHGLSHESLISYPRTSVNGFHTETWHRFQTQHLKIPGLPAFRPDAARSTLASAVPHESLHPLSLSASPEKVSGSLPETSGRLYEMIYRTPLRR